MNKKLVLATIFVLVLIAGFLAARITPTYAQASNTPIPTLQVPTPTSDLEFRLNQLEVEQNGTIDVLKSSNEYNQFLIQVIGGIIALLVAIQSITTAVQLRREGRREKLQRRREERQDLAEVTGVEQVSKILAVVQQTLESRLATEQLAQTVVKNAQEQLVKVQKEVKVFERFYENYQANIQKTRQSLEETATRWATDIKRHGFRRMVDDLVDFARRLDQFKRDSETLEEEKRSFSPRVLYIQGIAALLSNQPATSKQSLTKVTSFQNNEKDENEVAYNRRVANANYYLGVIESNFGNETDAIAYFETANKLDPGNTDILTKVVTAESYVMKSEFSKALSILSEIESTLREMEHGEQHQLRNHLLRLQSRTLLIRANIAIMSQEDNWQENVKTLLEPVYKNDEQYYYATYTLAQAFEAQGQSEYAKDLFRKAYETIISLNDLHVVREARSKIVLLMVAGICAKHGIPTDKYSEDYLDQADSLRSDLPKISDKVCTVFSPLSKKNEFEETIHHHIELIRSGQILL